MNKIIYIRMDEELEKKFNKLIAEYNEKYPANIKLKKSTVFDILMRGILREVDTAEELREYIKKLL